MADDAPPKLTMPEAESLALQAAYEAADCILEYGMGGSTVLAAALPGRNVFSVESDAKWVERLQRWFLANPPAATLALHHADIGKVGKWGRPIDNNAVTRWPRYPLSVWDLPDFSHPDVVLVDGRFRMACMVTTLLRITRPVIMLVDDYIDRPGYHAIEDLTGAPEMIGRMARFAAKPTAFPLDCMLWAVTAFANPN